MQKRVLQVTQDQINITHTFQGAAERFRPITLQHITTVIHLCTNKYCIISIVVQNEYSLFFFSNMPISLFTDSTVTHDWEATSAPQAPGLR